VSTLSEQMKLQGRILVRPEVSSAITCTAHITSSSLQRHTTTLLLYREGHAWQLL
jgi:hypothetical protein